MILMLIFFIQISSLKIEQLPISKSSPPRLIHTTSSVVSSSSKIYFYGGEEESGLFSCAFYSYDIELDHWKEIISYTTLSPPCLSQCKSFITSNNSFFIIFGKTAKGISENIYVYDLNLSYWKFGSFSGDYIYPTIDSAECFFTFGKKRYLGLYGGILVSGISQHFYLIDTETLEVQAFYENYPGNMTEGSLVFYNDSLYLFGVVEGRSICQLFRFDLTEKTWYEIKTSSDIPARKGHKSSVNKNFMFVFFGYNLNEKYSEILRLDLTLLTWSLIKNDIEYSYGSTSQTFENYVSFGLGKSLKNYENSIILFYFESENYTVHSESADFPVGRKNHISWVYNNSIFIFGGLSSSGDTLNDMWRFDIDSDCWVYVKTYGNIPAKRELMGYFFINGSGLTIMGGKSGNTIFQEIYFYEPKASLWTMLNEGNNITSRFDPCIFFYSFKILIFGGQNFEENLNDMWIYDFSSATFTQIELKYKNHLSIANYKCAFKSEGLLISLHLIGGTDSSNEPSKEIIQITIKNIESKPLNGSVSSNNSENLLSLKDFSISLENSTLFIFGGKRNQEVSKFIHCYDLVNKKIIRSILLPESLWVAGHSLVQLGQSFYLFGGIHSPSGFQTSDVVSNELYQISFNEEPIFLTCKFGMIIEGRCQPCPPGFYSISNDCLPCPNGTFYQYRGACEIQMCTPCQFGEFNDEEGKTFCKICRTGLECPLGSSVPLEKSKNLTVFSKQPGDYLPKDTALEDLYFMLLWIFGALAFVLLFLVIFWKRTRSKFLRIDQFVTQHSQELNVPVIYRKTVIGGYFTVIFLLFAVITSVYTLIAYLDDNISESKSLVPLISVKDDIVSSFFFINFTFYNLIGECKENDTFWINSSISFKTISFTVKKEGTNCQALIKYEDFLLSNNGKISFSFQNIRYYCSHISVNLASSSSIPDQNSEIFIPLYPNDRTHVFRGFIPSKFKVLLLPSVRKTQVFYSDSSSFDSKITGFHLVDAKNHETGTTVDQYSFNSMIFLMVDLELQLNENAFITKRLEKYTPFMFLGTLLGSVIGIMESFATLMAWTEVLFEAFEKRSRRKVHFQGVVQGRKGFGICMCEDQFETKMSIRFNTTD